jgi:hypothetical protein
MMAFTILINGDNEEKIGCIYYKDEGIALLYDGSIMPETDMDGQKLTPTPTTSPTATPTPSPVRESAQNSQEKAKTAQIEHIYDPETLSINNIPNGLYEAILNVEEMRESIYQYMYANHIYDVVVTIDGDYAINGPYYDFKVIMSNDSRDIYVRYDSGSDRYYCAFNEF